MEAAVGQAAVDADALDQHGSANLCCLHAAVGMGMGRNWVRSPTTLRPSIGRRKQCLPAEGLLG